MKARLSLIFIMALCAATAMFSQQPLSSQDREKWLSEMRNYKHEFLTRELKLTPTQQQEFFPVYDQMEDELNQISTETRELEQKVNGNDDASDTECEACARAVFEQKSREGAIELQYFEKFKEILTPKQLLRLKNTERKFTQQLVKHHGRNKGNDNRQKQ